MAVVQVEMKARLQLRVTARAAADRVDRLTETGVLPVRVTAPPVDGKANTAVLRLLAKALGVPSRDITLVSGAGSRDKLVEVDGLDEAELRARLSR